MARTLCSHGASAAFSPYPVSVARHEHLLPEHRVTDSLTCMNLVHRYLCASTAWMGRVRTTILP
jgi:hypothetical protein